MASTVPVVSLGTLVASPESALRAEVQALAQAPPAQVAVVLHGGLVQLQVAVAGGRGAAAAQSLHRFGRHRPEAAGYAQVLAEDGQRLREAASLIEAYLSQHPDLDRFQRANLHWHAAQALALSGYTAAALKHMSSSRLDPEQFVRIHRSTIVNVHRIREIQPWFRGHHRVVLLDGTELRMSRYQRDVAKRLGL